MHSLSALKRHIIPILVVVTGACFLAATFALPTYAAEARTGVKKRGCLDRCLGRLQAGVSSALASASRSQQGQQPSTAARANGPTQPPAPDKVKKRAQKKSRDKKTQSSSRVPDAPRTPARASVRPAPSIDDILIGLEGLSLSRGGFAALDLSHPRALTQRKARTQASVAEPQDGDSTQASAFDSASESRLESGLALSDGGFRVGTISDALADTRFRKGKCPRLSGVELNALRPGITTFVTGLFKNQGTEGGSFHAVIQRHNWKHSYRGGAKGAVETALNTGDLGLLDDDTLQQLDSRFTLDDQLVFALSDWVIRSYNMHREGSPTWDHVRWLWDNDRSNVLAGTRLRGDKIQIRLKDVRPIMKLLPAKVRDRLKQTNGCTGFAFRTDDDHSTLRFAYGISILLCKGVDGGIRLGTLFPYGASARTHIELDLSPVPVGMTIVPGVGGSPGFSITSLPASAARRSSGDSTARRASGDSTSDGYTERKSSGGQGSGSWAAVAAAPPATPRADGLH